MRASRAAAFVTFAWHWQEDVGAEHLEEDHTPAVGGDPRMDLRREGRISTHPLRDLGPASATVGVIEACAADAGVEPGALVAADAAADLDDLGAGRNAGGWGGWHVPESEDAGVATDRTRAATAGVRARAPTRLPLMSKNAITVAIDVYKGIGSPCSPTCGPGATESVARARRVPYDRRITMSDLLVRHWTVLKMIPRAPRKIDTSTIVQRLAAEHAIKTTPRTIQRDLQRLNEVFPLECDHLGQHFGWSWLKTADLFDLPGMDPQTALTLKLASLFLPRVLPRSTVRFLDAHVKRADAVLKEKLGTQLHRAWASKVRVVPKGLAFVPPKIRADVLEVVYDAVFEERCFEARYVPRREGVAKTRIIHPQALIYRDAGAYLACMIGEHDGIVTLALHRIEAATLLETKRRAPASFDVDEYVARGSAGYRYAEAPLALDALVETPLAQVLAETPLALEQEIEPAAEGRHRLHVRLPDNWDLRSWILAQGDAIEVVEPASLREEIADFLESAATVYGRAKRRHPRVNAAGYVVRAGGEK